MFAIEHPDVEGGAVVPERSLATYAQNGWVLAGRTAAAAPEAPPTPLTLPARNASVAVWKTYAVVAGMDYDAAMAATRDDLADKFHPAESKKATPVVKNPKES